MITSDIIPERRLQHQFSREKLKFRKHINRMFQKKKSKALLSCSKNKLNFTEKKILLQLVKLAVCTSK